MRPYERFEAWKLAHELFLAVQKEIKTWPSDERFGMVAQVRRSAFSVPANIVEGSAKRGPRELAKDLGYLPVERWSPIDGLASRAGKCLSGLARALDGREGGPPDRPTA